MDARQITYEWFAENYHFTEEMTDSLSVDALEWWPVIRAARLKAQETRQHQAERLTAARPQSQQFMQGMRTPGSG